MSLRHGYLNPSRIEIWRQLSPDCSSQLTVSHYFELANERQWVDNTVSAGRREPASFLYHTLGTKIFGHNGPLKKVNGSSDIRTGQRLRTSGHVAWLCAARWSTFHPVKAVRYPHLFPDPEVRRNSWSKPTPMPPRPSTYAWGTLPRRVGIIWRKRLFSQLKTRKR